MFPSSPNPHVDGGESKPERRDGSSSRSFTARAEHIARCGM
jgi:hypothetical protein